MNPRIQANTQKRKATQDSYSDAEVIKFKKKYLVARHKYKAQRDAILKESPEDKEALVVLERAKKKYSALLKEKKEMSLKGVSSSNKLHNHGTQYSPAVGSSPSANKHSHSTTCTHK